MSKNLSDLLVSKTEDSINKDGEIGRSSEEAIKLAEKNNWSVVFPSEHALQIDIDSADAYETFKRHKDILDKTLGIEDCSEWPSKSGLSWRKHITIRLKQPISAERRILLQAAMGSDRMREILSFARLINGDPNPTLFFEKNS